MKRALAERARLCPCAAAPLGVHWVQFVRPSGRDCQRMIAELRRRLRWSSQRTANVLGVAHWTFRRWVAGERDPNAGSRRLIWLVWISHLHPRLLRRPDAWMRWYGVRETEAEARLRKLGVSKNVPLVKRASVTQSRKP